jgi:hypothetical protein
MMTAGRDLKAMSNQESIKAIREQLKGIKESITVIEFRLSQLKSESQAPVASSLSRRSARFAALHYYPRW